MACREKVLVVVVAVFLGLLAKQHVTLVNGDEGLVLQTCENTANATACHNCMYSEPGVLNENIIGLARRSINCTSSQSQKALQIAKNGANSTYSAQAIDAYYFCAYRIAQSDVPIMDAYRSFQDGRYAEAGRQVVDGIPASTKCSDQFKTVEDPEGLASEVLTLQTLQNVSAAVIAQIEIQ